MKRIPVFLRYFNMPPFTPMLTQPMLFYLKRPNSGNNSGANYPRELKLCPRAQVRLLHNIMKRIPVFLRYFNMPPFTPMLTQPMLFYLKRPNSGNNSGANYPRELKLCPRAQVMLLHNIMKRIPVFLRYFNMPPFTPMLTQPMLFYLKRPNSGNNSGANYPRETQTLPESLGQAITQYYEKNSGLSALFQYAPIYAHVNAAYVILFKKTQFRE